MLLDNHVRNILIETLNCDRLAADSLDDHSRAMAHRAVDLGLLEKFEDIDAMAFIYDVFELTPLGRQAIKDVPTPHWFSRLLKQVRLI